MPINNQFLNWNRHLFIQPNKMFNLNSNSINTSRKLKLISQRTHQWRKHTKELISKLFKACFIMMITQTRSQSQMWLNHQWLDLILLMIVGKKQQTKFSLEVNIHYQDKVTIKLKVWALIIFKIKVVFLTSTIMRALNWKLNHQWKRNQLSKVQSKVKSFLLAKVQILNLKLIWVLLIISPNKQSRDLMLETYIKIITGEFFLNRILLF